MFRRIAIKLAPNNIFHSYYREKDSDGITPQTRAIFFCMIATGMERIFTHNDCHELVFRLAVIFRQLDVIDNFFKDGFLFTFNHQDQSFRITPSDLVAHIGLHTTDYPDEATPLDQWYGNLQKHWERAIWSSILCGGINPLAHFVFEIKSENQINVKMKTLNVKPTREHIRNASILGENVMKEIPEEPFMQFREKEKEKLDQMGDFIAFTKSPLPLQYDWRTIPKENQQAILKHLVEPKFYNDGMTMDDVIKEYADWVPDLVYLAWINANGFAIDLYNDEIDPRVDIDPSKYEELGVEGGINLGITYDFFNLNEIEKFLVQKKKKPRN